jgi:D-alanine-D-alanine ligase
MEQTSSQTPDRAPAGTSAGTPAETHDQTRDRTPERTPEQAQRRRRRLRVAVVFGGRSSEHGVSCLTAGEVIRAIDPDRYDVVPIGITREGRWVLESRDPHRFAITDRRLPSVDPAGTDVVLAGDPTRRELSIHEPGELPRTLGDVDVVLPLLHGPWGEDGTLQGMLELAEVRYVGAGVLASAVGMDKQHMKIAFAAAGLPMLPYVVVTPRRWAADPSRVREAVAALTYPVFVKPARAGSSVGISCVDSPEQLDAALDLARQSDPKVIVEAAALNAREIECGVLDSPSGPEASQPGEIVIQPGSGHTWYDFDAKYVDGGGTAVVPADLPAELAELVREQALTAFESISAEGLARVDFFLLPDQRLVINEINTMPGFTPTSMFPAMWAAQGVSYPELVDRLLRTALERPVGLR